MDHAQQCHSRRTDPLCRGLLTSYLDTYTRYLMGAATRGAQLTATMRVSRIFSQWVRDQRQARAPCRQSSRRGVH